MTLSRKDHAESVEKIPHSRLRNRLATGVIAGFMALSTPLLENSAYAQAPPPKPEQQEQKPEEQKPVAVPVENAAPAPGQETAAVPNAAAYEVNFPPVSITDDSKDPKVSLNAYVVSRQAGKYPSVKVEGPVLMTLQFYPAVLKELFTLPDTKIPRKLAYTFGPVEGEQKPVPSDEKMTGLSEFKGPVSEIDNKVMRIGTPIPLTITVPKGRHVLIFTAPNGFLEVVSVVPVVPTKPIEPPKPAVAQTPDKQPQQNEPAEDKKGFSLELKGDHVWVSGLGDSKNKGMITDAELLFKGRGSMFGGYGGLLTTSYGMSLDTERATSMLRMTSIDATGGLSLHFGDHTVYAGPLVGLRLVGQSISPNIPVVSQANPDMLYQFEVGGMGGYEVDFEKYRIFGAFVRGTNNPYNPITGGLYFISPWGWAPDHNNPELTFNMRWMHLMKPSEDGSVGGYGLTENNLFMHGNLIIPIWKLGPIVPSALIGLEMNKTIGGGFSAQPFFGGLLRAQFSKDFYLQAGAAVNLEKNPFLLLQLGY